MQRKIINLFKHLKVIALHKYYVAKYCFKFRLYKRGLFHDLSKYSWAELWPSADFFNAGMSPQVKERQAYDGYSYMSVHHCGRNSHHYQHHVDINRGRLLVCVMPLDDVLEMFCDSLAASIVYAGKGAYNRSIPLEFFQKQMNEYVMHPASKELLVDLFKEYELNDFENLKIDYIKRKYLEIQTKYLRVYKIELNLNDLNV